LSIFSLVRSHVAPGSPGPSVQLAWLKLSPPPLPPPMGVGVGVGEGIVTGGVEVDGALSPQDVSRKADKPTTDMTVTVD
jgi:hypothetical protein